MTDRDIAITNKALCYATGTTAIAIIIVFHVLGSHIAFYGGLLCGLVTVFASEFLISIPPK